MSAAADPKPPNGEATQRQDQLWDDDAFRQRCIDLATERGLTIRDTVIGAETSADYLLKSQIGRNTNVVMRLARYFNVDPAWLAWGDPQRQTQAYLGEGISIPATVTNEQRNSISRIICLLQAIDPKDYADKACTGAVELILRRAAERSSSKIV